jgi:hypothetical protein
LRGIDDVIGLHKILTSVRSWKEGILVFGMFGHILDITRLTDRTEIEKRDGGLPRPMKFAPNSVSRTKRKQWEDTLTIPVDAPYGNLIERSGYPFGQFISSQFTSFQ